MIEKSSFAELEADPDFSALLEEYAASAAREGLPPAKCKAEIYRALEAMGTLHVWTARLQDGRLIGFLLIICTVLPHFSLLMGVSESYFVAKQFRHTGAAIRLLRLAEEKVRELGGPVLLMSAPVGSALAEVLPRAGYTPMSMVFYKRVQHDA